ncbi:MAG TPA: hypothetical protein VKA67_06675, partial [Verrucomicrobiae bacterium]|nr:hypothetical protein [Verrucomicrobiae bacterium]
MKLNLSRCFSWGAIALIAQAVAAAQLPNDGSPPNRSVASVRTVEDFDFDWRFRKGDFATAMMPVFDDSGWRHVNVPHDWSIEGPFGPEY